MYLNFFHNKHFVLKSLSRIFLRWRWRRSAPPKHRFTQDVQHVTSQKMEFSQYILCSTLFCSSMLYSIIFDYNYSLIFVLLLSIRVFTLIIIYNILIFDRIITGSSGFIRQCYMLYIFPSTVKCLPLYLVYLRLEDVVRVSRRVTLSLKTVRIWIV